MSQDYYQSLNSMLTAYRSLIRSSLMFCKRYNRLSSSIKRTIDTWAHPMYVTSYVKLLSLQKKELEELVEKEADRAISKGEGMDLEDNLRGNPDDEESNSRKKKLEDEGKLEGWEKREKLEGNKEMMSGQKMENAAKLQRQSPPTTLKIENMDNKEVEDQIVLINASKESIKMENEGEAKQFEQQIENQIGKKLEKRRSPRLAFKKDQNPQRSKREENKGQASVKMNDSQSEESIQIEEKEEDNKDAHFLGLQSEMLPEFLTKRINKDKSDNDYIANLSRLNREYLRGPYKSYTVEEKTNAVSMFVNEYKSITEISKLLGIPCKNIKRWASEGIYRKRGGGRRKTSPEVEQETYEWIINTFTEEDEIQACWIQEYALRQSKDPQFKASRGWLLNFLDRYDVRRTYTII